MLLLIGTSSAAQEYPGRDYSQWRVSLITLGPGTTYWERFGHNAILVEPAEVSPAYLYNFGLFDFQSESFLLNFALGKMEYLAAAFDGDAEMRHYAAGDRSVRQQVLNLAPDAKQRIIEHLEWHRTPPNNTYVYDYYVQNCSTKVRDALDLALDGQLKRQFAQSEARFGTFRDHTHRLTGPEPWLYTATDLGLGRAVDQPISRWDEFFVPMELADALASISGLVASDRYLPVSDPIVEPKQEPLVWPWFLLAGLLVSTVVLFAPRIFVVGYGLVSTVAFLGMVALWTLTDHQAAYVNQNLLLFTPLWLIAYWKPRIAFVAGALWIVSLALQILPGSQDQWNWLAFTLIPAVACIRLSQQKINPVRL